MVNFHRNPTEKATTAAFAGKLDTAAAQSLPEILKHNLPTGGEQEGEKIVFDLKDVEYISSFFIRICIMVAKQIGAEHFSIIHCQPRIKATFQIAGLEKVLNVT